MLYAIRVIRLKLLATDTYNKYEIITVIIQFLSLLDLPWIATKTKTEERLR